MSGGHPLLKRRRKVSGAGEARQEDPSFQGAPKGRWRFGTETEGGARPPRHRQRWLLGELHFSD
jgi:hypothetical protein